ncbi:MAG: fumarylacetoacetate hydrolase family protein [Chloroflexi bacterium]|nr:fumarylacetoacetate hydrolase family protein [Chloroflexota bacterium]
MKIIRYERCGNEAYGVLDGDSVRAVQGSICSDFKVSDEVCKLDQVKLLAPVQPGLIVGVAGNRVLSPSEIAEHGHDHSEFKEPVIFFKASSSVIGPLDNIVIPAASNGLLIGPEVAVVMRREALQVSEDRALEYILGYTSALDVSVRGLVADPFAARAKSYHTFCPMGPLIATDLDCRALRVTCRHNNVAVLDMNTSNWLFSVASVISSISQFMTLRPLDAVLMGSLGDLLGTADGDVVEVEIEGIGRLRNTVVRS